MVKEKTIKSSVILGLKVLVMLLLLLCLTVFMIAYSVCGITPQQQHEHFLKYLHAESPDPYKDCLINYIDTHWQAVQEKYQQDIRTGKYRAPRIPTDEARDLISEYLPICEKQK